MPNMRSTRLLMSISVGRSAWRRPKDRSCDASSAARRAASSDCKSEVTLFAAEARSQLFGARQDDRQQIVEIMGDAARQIADGFHFLRMSKPSLGQSLLGDILDRADKANSGSPLVAEKLILARTERTWPSGRTIRYSISAGPFPLAASRLTSSTTVSILGMHERQICVHGRDERVRPNAEDSVGLCRPCRGLAIEMALRSCRWRRAAAHESDAPDSGATPPLSP